MASNATTVYDRDFLRLQKLNNEWAVAGAEPRHTSCLAITRLPRRCPGSATTGALLAGDANWLVVGFNAANFCPSHRGCLIFAVQYNSSG